MLVTEILAHCPYHKPQKHTEEAPENLAFAYDTSLDLKGTSGHQLTS